MAATSSPAARAPAPILLFLHIPKAAGTTFDVVIRRQVRSSEVFELDLNEGQVSLAAYKQLAPQQRRAFRLVTGHMPFGLHAWVPEASTYVTLLRDPVERMVSYYYYVLASPKHYLYRRVMKNNLGLADFVSQGLSTELDNGQTRQLAAEDARHLPHRFGELTPDLLDSARRNLETHFAVAGVAEQFNATLLLRAKLGWPYPSLFYLHQNRTAERPALSAIAPGVLDAIRRHQQMDLALYDFAKRRFEQELERHVPQPALATARLSAWLRVYRPLYTLYGRVRRAMPRALKRQSARWRARAEDNPRLRPPQGG